MQTIATILVWLFIFLLPSQFGKHFFLDFSYINGVRIDYLAPAIYLTDILGLGLVVLYWKHVWEVVKEHRQVVACTLVFFSMQGFNVQHPVLIIGLMLKIYEIFLILSLFSSIKIPNRLFYFASIAGASVQLALATAQLKLGTAIQGVFYFLGERAMSLSTPGIAKASLQGEEFLRPYGTFSHPNSMGGFYLLLLAWTLSRRPTNDQETYLRLALLALSSMLILLSFSKAAIIAGLVIFVIYLWQNRKNISCTTCTLGRILIGLSVAGLFLLAHGDAFSWQKRFTLFQQGVDIIRHNALLGTGLGHYLYAQAKYPSPYPYFFLQPVHNIFILFIMQVGIIAGGAALWKIVAWTKRHWKTVALPATAILLTGNADHYWITLQQNMLLLAVVVGMTHGHLPEHKNAMKPSSRE